MKEDHWYDYIIYGFLYVVAHALASEWIGVILGVGAGILIGIVIGASL